MRWFRSNIRFGSRLALLALAVQLVLTFGHVHGLAAAAANPGIASLSNASDPMQKSSGSADFDCPICALIQLASTPSVAPALPVPASFAIVRRELRDELEWAASPYYPFQARASPSI